MSKRFTETEKWHDPWFRKLPPKYKCFWNYICDTCNNAGIWTVDFELAEILIGDKIDLEDIKRYFQDQIRPIREGKYWMVRDFVRFQYGSLSKDSKPHQQVLSLLLKHRVSKGYLRGIHTPKDKDKDKGKDKERGTGGKQNGENQDFGQMSHGDLLDIHAMKIKALKKCPTGPKCELCMELRGNRRQTRRRRDLASVP